MVNLMLGLLLRLMLKLMLESCRDTGKNIINNVLMIFVKYGTYSQLSRCRMMYKQKSNLCLKLDSLQMLHAIITWFVTTDKKSRRRCFIHDHSVDMLLSTSSSYPINITNLETYRGERK